MGFICNILAPTPLPLASMRAFLISWISRACRCTLCTCGTPTASSDWRYADLVRMAICFATDTVQLEPSKVQKLLSSDPGVHRLQKGESQAPGELPRPPDVGHVNDSAPAFSHCPPLRRLAQLHQCQTMVPLSMCSTIMRPSADKSPDPGFPNLGRSSEWQANKSDSNMTCHLCRPLAKLRGSASR